MWLQKLQAEGLRSFKQCEISFSHGINVLFGENGAGKTSILEGIHVLSCGKSFRTSSLVNVTHHDASMLTLYGEVVNLGNTSQLGVRISSSSEKELRLNRETTSGWSELAKSLPVLDIHPESYLLVTSGPSERRKFLNWGVFHVEQGFSKMWSEYSKAVKQRNFCLKTRNISQAKHWHHTLADHGEAISKQISNYCLEIVPRVNEILSLFGFTQSIRFEYTPGWDSRLGLKVALDNELRSDDLSLFTQVGPHRGDLKISWNGKLFAKTSSRGQQKMMAIALKLAQAKTIKQKYGKSIVYLVDELQAELDGKQTQIALEILAQLDSQIIITALSREAMKRLDQPIKWFHVKHGCVSSVV